MLEGTLIQKLKQSNVSVDADKTKERTESSWKSLSRKDKQQVLSLAGVSPATIYRIYNTGNISAKLAVPLAQVLDVNPAYLTGAADEQGTGDDDTVRAFLTEHGYEKLLAGQKPRRSRKSRETAADRELRDELVEAEAIEEETVEEAAEVLAAAVEAAEEELEEIELEDMILLMRGLLLRARLGSPKAVETTQKLKSLLING